MTLAILTFALGFFSGMLANDVYFYFKKVTGVLKIDSSDPKKDLYKLEIKDLDKLKEKRLIIFKVDANADISQK